MSKSTALHQKPLKPKLKKQYHSRSPNLLTSRPLERTSSQPHHQIPIRTLLPHANSLLKTGERHPKISQADLHRYAKVGHKGPRENHNLQSTREMFIGETPASTSQIDKKRHLEISIKGSEKLQSPLPLLSNTPRKAGKKQIKTSKATLCTSYLQIKRSPRHQLAKLAQRDWRGQQARPKNYPLEEGDSQKPYAYNRSSGGTVESRN